MIRTLTAIGLLPFTLFVSAPAAAAAARMPIEQNGKSADALPEDSKKAVTRAANEVATITDQMKKVVGSTMKKKGFDLNQAERQEVTREIEVLSKAARTLASHVAAKQPSAADAKTVVTQATEVGEMLEARKLSSTVAEMWTTINSHVQTIAQAYKLTK